MTKKDHSEIFWINRNYLQKFRLSFQTQTHNPSPSYQTRLMPLEASAELLTHKQMYESILGDWPPRHSWGGPAGVHVHCSWLLFILDMCTLALSYLYIPDSNTNSVNCTCSLQLNTHHVCITCCLCQPTNLFVSFEINEYVVVDLLHCMVVPIKSRQECFDQQFEEILLLLSNTLR